ncbi:MAG: TonB-dependent receptor plug domain-containing protein, partial [Gammaproteobacteria bacterium]|nr:TonB-dependent receptor plug domain-containing protein [Gammaproteobacteria bacterium]
MLNKKILLIIPTLMIPTVTLAVDDTSLDEQNEVIVVIGKVPRLISDVVGSTTVIGSETIEKELAHNLKDLVRYQAGINIENSGTRFGSSGFSIRGIGGNRITTEIDGIPIPDQFSIGSYSNSGRNFIDTDLIQQVEILRGPASSIYGSDAIGGVVSFITKKPVDLLSQTDNDVYLGLKTGYYSVDNSRLLSASTAFASGDSSALFSASTRNGHEYDNQAAAAAGVDDQDNETKSFLAKYFLSLSENQELIFSYDYFNRQAETDINSFIGLGRFSSTTELLGDDESKRENLSINYEFTLESDWLEGGVVRVYQQKTETEQLTDEVRFSRGVNYL